MTLIWSCFYTEISEILIGDNKLYNGMVPGPPYQKKASVPRVMFVPHSYKVAVFQA